MKRYGVWVTFEDISYIEVEAENEEEAEELGWEAIVERGEGEHYSDNEYAEVEEL